MDDYYRVLRDWNTEQLIEGLRIVPATERPQFVCNLLRYLLVEVEAIYHPHNSVAANRNQKAAVLTILLHSYAPAANTVMVDANGNYPLHLAVLYAPQRDQTYDSVATYVEVLLRNDACATVPNREGFTPLDLWKQRRPPGELTSVVRLLEDAARPNHIAMLERFVFGQEDSQRPSYLSGCPELTRMISELTFRGSWEDAQRDAIHQIEADGMDGAIFDQRALDSLVVALNRGAPNAMAGYRKAYAIERPARLMVDRLLQTPGYRNRIGEWANGNELYGFVAVDFLNVYLRTLGDADENFGAPWHTGRYAPIQTAFDQAGLTDPEHLIRLLHDDDDDD